MDKKLTQLDKIPVFVIVIRSINFVWTIVNVLN